MNLNSYTTASWSLILITLLFGLEGALAETHLPYSAPAMEREAVYTFTEKPATTFLGHDRYKITFAVKGLCDVTVALINDNNKIVRHLASGVLGRNAPSPLQANTLKQTLYWDGKDDFEKYVKEPSKLRVRVSLGLNPTFDKLIGDDKGQNLPRVWGLASNKDGVYVVTKPGSAMSQSHLRIRRYDRDGNFKATIFPPPSTVPHEKLEGMGFVEFEKGKRSLQGPRVKESVSSWGGYAIPGLGFGQGPQDCQPTIIGKRIYLLDDGLRLKVKDYHPHLHYIHTDGSTTLQGIGGRRLTSSLGCFQAILAHSPDGKYLYAIGPKSQGNRTSLIPAVFRQAVDGNANATRFIGKTKPGNDNQHLNRPHGLDCDAQGRLYIADTLNNRVQIFSPEGTFLKSIKIRKPTLLQVHKKSGALYVFHSVSKQGKSFRRLTKFTSFQHLVPGIHQDHLDARVMTLDSFSEKPRIWIAGSNKENNHVSGAGYAHKGPGLSIWEESEKGFEKIVDFTKNAQRLTGAPINKIHRGGIGFFVDCDAVRNHVYLGNIKSNKRFVFDLATGNYLRTIHISGLIQDVAFDKRGYMHCHLIPGSIRPAGVTRLNPELISAYVAKGGPRLKNTYVLKEVPYNYGVLKGAWSGAIATACQSGAKSFQDGLGADLRGNLAVNSNIYYIPKMEDDALSFAIAGALSKETQGRKPSTAVNNATRGMTHAQFMREFVEREKTGERIFSIPRQPGIPLNGATIWTFESTGEIKQECAAIIGDLLNGVEMDVSGDLYFVTARPKVYGKRYFLDGSGGTLGDAKAKRNRQPFTGTLIKSGSKDVRFLTANAKIPMEARPQRTPDLANTNFGAFDSKNHCWVNGAKWLYAGASPIVSEGCSCPTSRFHVDWFKRSFVPEAYRHSMGILDTNGNLIMHLGRYGVYGEGYNASKQANDIRINMLRFIGGTDEYLCFYDFHERLVALKIAYHAEATATVKGK